MKDRCPYIKGIQAGDEGIDFCELNGTVCELWVGRNECETWEDIKKEDAYVCPGDLCDGKLDLKVNKE